MSESTPTTPETEPGTAKHRLVIAATLANDIPGNVLRITDEHAPIIENAVENDVLPERVLEHARDHSFNIDRVQSHVDGFRRAAEEALKDDGSFEHMPIEKLWTLSCDFSERIRNIDHSGRGSGCCQAESGLKTRRKAVRWIITGSWDH